MLLERNGVPQLEIYNIVSLSKLSAYQICVTAQMKPLHWQFQSWVVGPQNCEGIFDILIGCFAIYMSSLLIKILPICNYVDYPHCIPIVALRIWYLIKSLVRQHLFLPITFLLNFFHTFEFINFGTIRRLWVDDSALVRER